MGNALTVFVLHVELVGEKGMIDEAQKALEEAEALKKVSPFLTQDYLLCFCNQLIVNFLMIS